MPRFSFRAVAIVTAAVFSLAGLSFGIIRLTSAVAMNWDDSKVPIVFSGGYDTDPRDGGRPIVLIAAALEVTPEVFREAFGGVRPAKDGRPSKQDAQRNKAALMKVLGPHNVTGARLDEVSNYYRYQPQRGELWRHIPAQAYAELEDGKIKRVVVTEPGTGYSTPPRASVRGMDGSQLRVSIQYDEDLAKNGAVRSITIE